MNGEALHEGMLQEDRQHLFHVVETPLVTLAEIRGAKVVPAFSASVLRPTHPQHRLKRPLLRLLAVTGTGREKNLMSYYGDSPIDFFFSARSGFVLE